MSDPAEPESIRAWRAALRAVTAECSAMRLESASWEMKYRELRARIDGAASGTVVAVGDDAMGQSRVLIHSTPDELMRGPGIVTKRVAMVMLE